MSDRDLLTLLAVRLRSRGTADAIAVTVGNLLGGSVADVADRLAAAVDLGQVRVRGEEGRHSLTPTGDAELSALLATDTDRAGRADLTTGYEAFLPLNRRFLAECVAWQDRSKGSTPGAPTEGSVSLAEFAVLVGALRPVLEALTARRARFGSYERRLTAALTAAAGDGRWVDAPSLDSVHTVWFELHEHLLATLGRDRTQEHVG